jgi:hypothetical protein
MIEIGVTGWQGDCMERDRKLHLFLLSLVSTFLLVLSISSAVSAGELEAAEHLNPYRSELSLQGFYELKAEAGGRRETQVIPTVRIAGRIRSEGRIDARFRLRKSKSWKASVRQMGREQLDPVSPILLQGKIAVGGGYRTRGARMMPSAASIIGKELKISFPGRAKGIRGSRQRIYTIRVNLDGSLRVSARVASVPAHAFTRGACAAAVGEGAATPLHRVAPLLADSAGKATSTAVTRRIVTISTDADPEWYAKYGANSNAEIAAIINAAEVIYDKQLGLRFKIVRQHLYTDVSPYQTTSSGEILSAFVENADNRMNLVEGSEELDSAVDIKHLFTGKNLDGAVLGIAYIGTVCAAPQYSYGVTQDYLPAANFGVFAHEVGHNLGAFHDTTDMSGLMYPSIRVPPASSFSSASLNDISYHLDNFGGCLATTYVEPLATPVATAAPTAAPTPPANRDISDGTLSINSRVTGTSANPLVRIAGRLRAADRSRIPNVTVYLMSGGEPLAAIATNSEGVYQFFVRVSIRSDRKLPVYVQSEGAELRTRTLYLSRTSAARKKFAVKRSKTSVRP